MRALTHFNSFGVNYRTKAFAAREASELLRRLDSAGPLEMLKWTEVAANDGVWVSLSEAANVNKYVRDVCGLMQPHAALQAVISLVREHNFNFPVAKIKIPKGLRSDAEQHEVDGVHPVITRLVAEKLATWEQLEEVYSLADAFKMYEVWAVDGVNRALSAEAARKEAEKKAKQR